MAHSTWAKPLGRATLIGKLSFAGRLATALCSWFPSPLLLLMVLALPLFAASGTLAAEPAPARLRIAFSSFRDRVRHPQLYFYEHDGAAAGRIVGGVPPVDKRSDVHPAFVEGGRAVYFCAELEGQTGVIRGWRLDEERPLEFPKLHAGDNAHMSPVASSDGGWIALDVWRRPGAAGRWDVLLYDTRGERLVELPGVNTPRGDERRPALSGDARWLAWSTHASDSEGGEDIRLLDRESNESPHLPGLNSSANETEPALSADGRWLAFVSDRAEGEGVRDIYLYDLVERQLASLPGLNSPGQEQSPQLSADGRYLVFVSERLDGAGERDILLYDRAASRLLPTPGLNSPRDEYDPCVLVVAE